ncbi:MAG: hypothetical protein ACYTEX_09955 [Planctomycetota bacterium]
MSRISISNTYGRYTIKHVEMNENRPVPCSDGAFEDYDDKDDIHKCQNANEWILR